MIERLYVHNFRCLENFTLDLVGRSSALVIGKNGALDVADRRIEFENQSTAQLL